MRIGNIRPGHRLTISPQVIRYLAPHPIINYTRVRYTLGMLKQFRTSPQDCVPMQEFDFQHLLADIRVFRVVWCFRVA